MTLIVSIKSEGFTVVVSDLLLSSKAKAKHSLLLPASGVKENTFNVDGWYLSSLQQKSIIINKNLAVTYAGNADQAKDIISFMKDYFKTPESVTHERIEEFVRAHTAVEKDISIMCHLIGPENLLSYFHYKTASEPHATYPKIPFHYAGSGGKEFKSMIRNCVIKHDPIKSEEDKMGFYLYQALLVSASLIYKEMISSTRFLQYLIGGGYEIIHNDKNGFRKLSDVMYVFWSYEKSDNDCHLLLNSIIMKISYHNSLMILRIFEVDIAKKQVIQNNIYVVNPVLSTDEKITDINELGDEILDLKCTFQFNYVLASDGNKHQSFGSLSINNQRIHPVSISVEDEFKLRLSIKSDLIDKLKNLAQSIIGS